MIIHSTGLFNKRGEGTPVPFMPPGKLVSRGLYQRSRNPMYLAYTGVVLGEALFFGSPALMLYAAAIFLKYHLMLILYEEPQLSDRFGESYNRYRKDVPRWF